MKVGVDRSQGTLRVVVSRKDTWFDFTRAQERWNVQNTRQSEGPMEGLEELLQESLLRCEHIEAVLGSLDDLDAYRLRSAPIFACPLRPGKIVALGRNYLAHARETGHDAPEEPVLFCKLPDICIGPEEAIRVRESYGRVDHEGELAILIGRTGKDIQPEDAQQYIAGYTLLNDVTARQFQKKDIERSLPWFRSKNLDTFCPLGPVVALPDALGWPVEVDIELRVNGEVRQSSNTQRFIFGIPEVLAYITQFMTLYPGDLISTGTPEGISPIHAGDIVEVDVPEIGVLSNPVVQG